MRVAIGATVLAAGTAGSEPARLVGAVGSKSIQEIKRIGSAKGSFASRGNRTYTDIIEADYGYTTAALAKAGIVARRIAALGASGNLTYDSGDNLTTLGPATVSQVELVEWTGCGFTMRFTIMAVEA